MAVKIEEKRPARTAHASEIPSIVPKGFGDRIAKRLELALTRLPPPESIVVFKKRTVEEEGRLKGLMEKALIEAVVLGHHEEVETLLEEGGNPNAVDRGGWTLLMNAAQNGDVKMVKLLVSRHALLDETNAMGWTALMCAAVSGREEVAGFLLAEGANADIKDGFGHKASKIAMDNGYPAIAELIKRYEKKL